MNYFEETKTAPCERHTPGAWTENKNGGENKKKKFIASPLPHFSPPHPPKKNKLA